MNRFKFLREKIEFVFIWLKRLATRLNESPRGHLMIFATAWILAPMMSLPLLILMLAGFYSFEAIGMTKPRSWLRQLGFGLLLGIGLYFIRFLILFPFASWMSSLIGGQFANPPSGIVRGNTVAYLFHITLAIVHAGFFEEFLYRGYLLNRTVAYLGQTRYRWAIAILAVGVLFGLLHFQMGITGVIFAFLWFILSSVVYLAIKRNIWPMMVSHAFADTATWTLAYVGWLPELNSAVMNFYGLR